MGHYLTVSYSTDWACDRIRAHGVTVVALLCVLLLQMAGWSLLLAHNLPRAERVVAEKPADKNSLVLGTDFEEYHYYYTNYPRRLSDITEINTLNEFYKRPLYGPISAILTIVLYGVLGVFYPANMYLILSFYPSLASILFYVLLRRSGLPVLHAALLTAICTLSFAWLSVFSVPESYSLTVCSGVICMLSGSRFAHAPRLVPNAAFRHAVVTGVGTWLYPPICGAVLLIVPALRTQREWLTVFLPCTAIAVLLAAIPNAIKQTVPDQIGYAKVWLSLESLESFRLVLSIVAAFLFFGLLAPVDDFAYADPRLDLVQVFSHWHIAAPVALLAVCFVVLIRHAEWRPISGIGVWFLAMIAFHIFYNPKEVLLYTPLPVTLLCYTVGIALASVCCRDVTGTAGFRTRAVWGLGAVLTAMVLSNARPILGGWG